MKLSTNRIGTRLLTGAVILSVAFVTFTGIGACGVDYLSDELACVKLSGQFMKSIVEGDVDSAFSSVKPYFPISQREFDNLVHETRAQLQGNQPSFGSTLSYKFVQEKRVDNFLLRFTFVIKHEMTVTVWKFLYYKPEGKWLLNSLNWNDRVSDLFLSSFEGD